MWDSVEVCSVFSECVANHRNVGRGFCGELSWIFAISSEVLHRRHVLFQILHEREQIFFLEESSCGKPSEMRNTSETHALFHRGIR